MADDDGLDENALTDIERAAYARRRDLWTRALARLDRLAKIAADWDREAALHEARAQSVLSNPSGLLHVASMYRGFASSTRTRWNELARAIGKNAVGPFLKAEYDGPNDDSTRVALIDAFSAALEQVRALERPSFAKLSTELSDHLVGIVAFAQGIDIHAKPADPRMIEAENLARMTVEWALYEDSTLYTDDPDEAGGGRVAYGPRAAAIACVARLRGETTRAVNYAQERDRERHGDDEGEGLERRISMMRGIRARTEAESAAESWCFAFSCHLSELAEQTADGEKYRALCANVRELERARGADADRLRAEWRVAIIGAVESRSDGTDPDAQ